MFMKRWWWWWWSQDDHGDVDNTNDINNNGKHILNEKNEGRKESKQSFAMHLNRRTKNKKSNLYTKIRNFKRGVIFVIYFSFPLLKVIALFHFLIPFFSSIIQIHLLIDNRNFVPRIHAQSRENNNNKNIILNHIFHLLFIQIHYDFNSHSFLFLN